MVCLVVESSGIRRCSPGVVLALPRDDDGPDLWLPGITGVGWAAGVG
jgi:hypothetical protein